MRSAARVRASGSSMSTCSTPINGIDLATHRCDGHLVRTSGERFSIWGSTSVEARAAASSNASLTRSAPGWNVSARTVPACCPTAGTSCRPMRWPTRLFIVWASVRRDGPRPGGFSGAPPHGVRSRSGRFMHRRRFLDHQFDVAETANIQLNQGRDINFWACSAPDTAAERPTFSKSARSDRAGQRVCPRHPAAILQSPVAAGRGSCELFSRTLALDLSGGLGRRFGHPPATPSIWTNAPSGSHRPGAC